MEVPPKKGLVLMTLDKLLAVIAELKPYTEITGEWVDGYNACLTIVKQAAEGVGINADV
jgi:hypothetical protein